ncbi:uncharacterized protein B0P05DRAFT_531801 [Gilbertella persicaria]|uniref:uncharacterized protein n=1 Tax=Gilbertella persicaria TaxID=101096 RepID=UPI0022212403|nr:uncharacterized protein B0P05DRAFT_531801 [Gilbertella persicaria]KAI8087654.1 hypothetical protein B0P05DRAFT_531801 [Gilbertella persicaria]
MVKFNSEIVVVFGFIGFVSAYGICQAGCIGAFIACEGTVGSLSVWISGLRQLYSTSICARAHRACQEGCVSLGLLPIPY